LATFPYHALSWIANLDEFTMVSEKKHHRFSSSGSRTEFEHHDLPTNSGHDAHHSVASDDAATDRLGISQKLANPLSGLSQERLATMGEEYARLAGLTDEEDLRAFRLGAMIAGDQTRYDTVAELTDREREVLERETTHKWSNPRMLYWVIASKSPPWTTLWGKSRNSTLTSL